LETNPRFMIILGLENALTVAALLQPAFLQQPTEPRP
jgi:hypothetical protein